MHKTLRFNNRIKISRNIINMPYRRGYRRRRRPRKRNQLAMTTRGGNNRRRIARVLRPLTLRPKSAIQRVVYTNTFNCTPGLSSNGEQQNYCISMIINSPWLFGNNWNTNATLTGQLLSPNEPIVALNGNFPDADSTIMPGIKEGGGQPFSKYQQGYVTGTKVSVVATPINNSSGQPIQLGYLYAHRSSTASSLQGTDKITDLNKRPFLQMKKLMGSQTATLAGASITNSSRLTVKHSPKTWNNIKDIRDNKQFSFSTQANDGVGAIPAEKDFLTIGVIPALNTYTVPGGNTQTKVTNFQLQLRVEQSILWTEPLDDKLTGNGNLAYPVPAYQMNSGPGYGASRMYQYLKR